MIKSNKFIVAVYVDNIAGVLTRVTAMFTRRGFNIDALAVGETERSEYSRITLTMSGDSFAKEQIINQLKKIHNVKKVDILDNEESVKRELLLIKVRYSSETRADIITASEVYRGKVIDYTSEAMCIEVTGEPSKVEAFINLMVPFGIIEMCRTGLVALERGKTSLLDRE